MWRGCYEPAGDAFRLVQHARDEIAKAKKEFTDYVAGLDAEIASKTAKSKRLDEKLLDSIAGEQIRTALLQADVAPKLVAGACAAVRARFEFKLIEENGAYSCEAEWGYGKMSAAQAVGAWLSSEGKSFTAPPKPTVGTTLRRIRDLIH